MSGGVESGRREEKIIAPIIQEAMKNFNVDEKTAEEIVDWMQLKAEEKNKKWHENYLKEHEKK